MVMGRVGKELLRGPGIGTPVRGRAGGSGQGLHHLPNWQHFFFFQFFLCHLFFPYFFLGFHVLFCFPFFKFYSSVFFFLFVFSLQL